ncbi:hypothetical protein EJ02DRAFT_185481 [Clathrospora elynae]|uniref:Uncharacterized protein n=1 Tax=Clathrospora elynae TaxID=706981 RepID=A0A6A5SP57_9PLEO|nr:hypothetical protein EJ02DRAFT_185481 [Clathrospora elynae]
MTKVHRHTQSLTDLDHLFTKHRIVNTLYQHALHTRQYLLASLSAILDKIAMSYSTTLHTVQGFGSHYQTLRENEHEDWTCLFSS